jgi:hypothetical protein
MYRLDDKRVVPWLGFEVGASDPGLSYGTSPASWGKLSEALEMAHTAGETTPLRAVAVAEGWLGAKAPCFPWVDRQAVLRRVRAHAAAWAFDELPGDAHLETIWTEAHARWDRLRTSRLAASESTASSARYTTGGVARAIS